MSDPHHRYRLDLVIDLIEDAAVAYSNAPSLQSANQLAHVGRTRVVTQGENRVVTALKDGAWQ